MSSSSNPVTEVEEEIDEEDCITEAEVCKVFDKLFLDMQGVLSQLMQQVQQIQMAGQMIPEKQLKALLKTEMERALLVRQQVVLEQFDIEYECFEEATWEFLQDEDRYPKVKKAVERFQALWDNATGSNVKGWRPGKDASAVSAAEDTMSPERTIEVAQVYFSSLTDQMRALVTQYKSENKNLQDPSVQQSLNMDFAKSANDAGEDALAALDVTLRQFETSVKAHSNNPQVARALAVLQMQQQQDMMALNQATM